MTRHTRRRFLAWGLASAGALATGLGLRRLLGPSVETVSGDVTWPNGRTIGPDQTVAFDPNVSTTVTVPAKNVVVRGTLQMRPANADVVHTLRFTGVNEAGFVGGGDDPIPSDIGLWVVGEGRLDALGTPKVAWNRSGTDPSWLSTDELIVAPTDVGNFGTDGFAPFTMGSPVPRAGPMVPAAEVLNLSRNCVIEGAPDARTHVFIRSSSPQTIRHVLLRHMGPRRPDGAGFTTFTIGRYALHFHKMGDAARGSLVEGVVARDCGSHCFVAHDSHGVTFRACISYNTFEDPYWWDLNADPARPPVTFSNDVVYDHCVAALVKVDPDFRGFGLTGFLLHSSTVPNSDKCIGCVAVGVQGNDNASGFHWPEQPAGVWEMRDCVAHNNRANGIFVWQNDQHVHLTERFAAYRNGLSGINHGAYINKYIYRDSMLLGNGEAGVTCSARSYDLVDRLRFERTTIVDSPIGFREGAINSSNPPAIVCSPTFTNVAVPISQGALPVPTFEVTEVC